MTSRILGQKTGWMVVSFIDVGKYKTDQFFIIMFFEMGNVETMNLVLEMLSFLRDFHLFIYQMHGGQPL